MRGNILTVVNFSPCDRNEICVLIDVETDTVKVEDETMSRDENGATLVINFDVTNTLNVSHTYET